MKRLTGMELKNMADTYLDTDDGLASVLLTLSACRLFEEATGTKYAETDLLISCVESMEKVNKATDLVIAMLGRDDHKADLN